MTAPVQFSLETDPYYAAAVWCYAPVDGACNQWDAPHICQTCLTAGDAHAYAKYLRRQFPGHLFGVRTVGATPKLPR